MDHEIIGVALDEALRRAEQDLAAIDMSLKRVHNATILNTMSRVHDTLHAHAQLLAVARVEYTEYLEEIKKRQIKELYNVRCRMWWRCLAMEVALGDIGPQALIEAAFLEMLDKVPSEGVLHHRLEALAQRLEAFEVAQNEHGELRSIQLDNR